MIEIPKLNMFGKSFNNIGDNRSHLCLSTLGDIYAKTSGRFIQIFKDGKLNIEDQKELFEVSSEEEFNKDGIYLVKSEKSPLVYLYLNKQKLLLSSGNNSFISYSDIQKLKPEEFLQALLNIGFYYKTYKEAVEAKIENGLIYVLEESSLYKITKGVYTKIEIKPENDISKLNSLKLGSILINGVNNFISSESALEFKIAEDTFIKLDGGQVHVYKDIILDSAFKFSSKDYVENSKGFSIYNKDGETFLEIDNLILRKSSTEYEPSLYNVEVQSPVSNMISKAKKVPEKPKSLELNLKYKNEFKPGDLIALQIASANEAIIQKYVNDEGHPFLQVTLSEPPKSEATFNITFKAEIGKDVTPLTEIVKVGTIVDGLPSKEGLSRLLDKNISINEIISVEIISQDTSIFYGTSSGKLKPSLVLGKVTSLTPFVIELKEDKNFPDSLLNNLKLSPIYKIGEKGIEYFVLFKSKDQISVQKIYMTEEETKFVTVASFGDLKYITMPKKDFNVYSGWRFDGHGVYSEKLIGLNPLFVGGIFEGVNGEEFPKYGKDLKIPENIKDSKYDDFIPNVAWVKKLIEESKKTT